MSQFKAHRAEFANQSGFNHETPLKELESCDTLSASVDLKDIIGDYDDTSLGTTTSFASVLNTRQQQQLSQSYFSLTGTLREDETTSFYSALQDGFSASGYGLNRGPQQRSGRDFWSDGGNVEERGKMVPQANFHVFWHDLVYEIKPKITLGSLWYNFEQTIKTRVSSAVEILGRGRSRSHDFNCSDDQINGQSSLKILQQISGSFKSGELTAVMGPSGAGKTSLLNFLSRRQEEGYSGSLYVDNSYRRLKISTIPQHDHLPEYLTVRENLSFASRLKNPQKNYDHKSNIETVSRLLSLEDCLDTRTKKISGGQQKRLAIAQELLSKPDILILDEPTSGLDSLTCYKTLMVLKDLVKSSTAQLIDPIAIVLTLHQPQQDVFELFDKVYVLANGGKAIYNGPPSRCTEFIERYSEIKIQDQYYNPASFVIEIASGEHGDEPIEALEAQVKLEFEADKRESDYRMALKSSSVQNEVNQNEHPKKYWSDRLNGAHNDKSPSRGVTNTKISLFIDQRIVQGYTLEQGSFLRKTWVLAQRYWISIMRDPKQLTMRIIFHIILPIFLALVMGTEPGMANACPRFKAQYQLNDLIKNSNTISEDVQEELFLTLENMGLLFVMLYSLIAANMSTVTLSFTLDMQSSLKEYFNGWYSMTSYVIARILADIPIGISLPILTLAIGYPLTGQMVGQNISVAYRVLMTASGIVLGSMVGQTMGMIFGAIYIGHVTTALFASQGATLPMIFLSGFVVRTKNMPRFVYGLSFLSYYKHSLDLTMIARYGFNVCNCDPATFTGKDVELLGVSDKLRSFTDFWLNSLADQEVEEESDMISSTTTALPSPNNSESQDIFKMFAKQVSLYNTYGVEIKSCRDFIPHQLHELSLDETNLSSAFLSLVLLLITMQLLLFLTVKLVIHFRKSL